MQKVCISHATCHSEVLHVMQSMMCLVRDEHPEHYCHAVGSVLLLHQSILQVIADLYLVHAQEPSSSELPAMIAGKRNLLFHNSFPYSMQPLELRILTHHNSVLQTSSSHPCSH